MEHTSVPLVAEPPLVEGDATFHGITESVCGIVERKTTVIWYLAIGATLISSAALTGLAYVTGHRIFATYLDLLFQPSAGEVTVFCGALTGAAMGFLWWNCYPAQVFMGDVGSLALGGALGTVAILIKQELLLIPIGGLFVIEALSVIGQVASFKFTGKRIFRMAPLHHHFELIGWKETQVVIRFWIVAFIFALMSLATVKLR